MTLVVSYPLCLWLIYIVKADEHSSATPFISSTFVKDIRTLFTREILDNFLHEGRYFFLSTIRTSDALNGLDITGYAIQGSITTLTASSTVNVCLLSISVRWGHSLFAKASDAQRIDDEGGYRITLGWTSIQAAPDRRLVKLLDLEYIPCLSIDLSTGQISGHYTMRLSISGWLWKVVMHRISVTRFKGDLQRVRPCIRQMEKHWHCTCRSVCASSRYLPPGQLER